MELIREIKDKINTIKKEKIFIIENDKEYYFFVGQIVYFIEHQSKTNINNCLKSIELYEEKTDSKVLREYIINRFSIYSYGLNENYDIFTKIFSNLLIYDPKTDIKKNLKYFYLGIYFENIILKIESEEDLNLKRQLSLSKFKQIGCSFDSKVI